MTGTVIVWNDARGFGFLEAEGDANIFVHYSRIQGTGFRSLAEGELVEFELASGPKGKYAQNVVPQGVLADV